MVTGLVFDIPQAAWMDDVLRLRRSYEPVRLRFPIEITVAGSSGLGWFSAGQSKAILRQRVRMIAQAFAPFGFQFEKVARFPNSNVYYLAPRDAACFHDFQRLLAGCGLSFEPTPFSYVPHCTIAILPQDVADTGHAEMMVCPVPTEEIRVSSVSIYSVDAAREHCVHEGRVFLGA